ncbi:MAG: protein-disulfide reductase DsbD family protein [Verrucomicrobia bacterium]|nr:protein-disulfide reductase DsbD family protein [Verrucomicrobiota bacterium]
MPSSRHLSSALPLFLLVCLCLLAPASLRAATKPSHVQASLVAADASVKPGQPVTVALRLVHDEHWHTYWLNPGTGLPTSLKWTLPPGWTAGEIQWPAPNLLKDKAGNIVGNGYEGDLLLPITLTPPASAAPGTSVELKAAAEWLMCEEICVPGSANVALTLPVSADAPKPDAAFGEKIRATIANLPRADAAWKVTASRSAKSITLLVTPAGPSAAGAAAPTNLHFFSDDGTVAYDLPQTVTPDGQGGFSLVLPVATDAPKDVKKLLGVLTTASTWVPGTALRGLRVETPFAAAAPVSTPIGQLLGTLALAFLGGLVLNLMPCVFPVLGIKILGFVNQSGQDKKKVVMHGLVFALGVLLSFWSLAAVLAVLRAGGQELGWGFQLQEPGFVFLLAAVMLVFAMNMSGVFEFGLSATGVGAELQMKSGYAGSFFTGVLATAVATPCSAPFLAPALGAALAVPTGESFVIFTAIAVGLSMPYLLLSIFPAAVKVLPRPGAWMETFKQFMAFPLYGTVGALVWVLTGQVGDDSLMAILGLVTIALGVWVYGRWTAPGASAGRVKFGYAGLAVLLAAGAWIGWPVPSTLKWEPWSAETVAKLRAENRIIYVDFTARWCATCQTNKKIVFHSSNVLKTFADKKIATLRADWTNKDPLITAELAAYNRSAVPFNLVWLPGKNDPVILPELLTPGIVLDAVK